MHIVIGKNTAAGMSNRMVYFMADEIEKYIASKYHIQYSLTVIGNDTAINDYFKLVTAPYVICSPSTFCLAASMANFYDPKLIIMSDSFEMRHIENGKRIHHMNYIEKCRKC